MKKYVKIWYVIAILAVVGVSVVSAGFGIIPDHLEIKEVHHDLPKTTYPNINMQYPPYDRGTQNYYYPEIKGRFNNSQTATWLNITSDATTISFTNVYTDYGIDTDGDGKYNYLAIDVWVNVKEAGY